MKPFPLPYLLLLLGFITGCSGKPTPGKQVLITEGFSKNVLDGYWIYLPKDYREDKKWPILMFLQGGDASAGPNPYTVKDGGPVSYLMKPQVNLPDSFIIVNPHMRTGQREQRQWFQHANDLVQITDQVNAKHHADPKRVYLTGQSRGGHGTWGVARRYPDKFAAIVPIAGAILCETNCEMMAGLPMWIIHNDGDPVVGYEYPQAAVDYLENELGLSFLRTSNLKAERILNSKAIFTTFDSDAHGGAGSRASTSPHFHNWLLSQKKEHRNSQ